MYGQSGLVILPVFDAERFDPGYDDHPMVVQYKKGMYLPSVIEYFRVLGVAEPIEYQKTQIVPTGGEWREARNENARVKEASVEDFLTPFNFHVKRSAPSRKKRFPRVILHLEMQYSY